MNWFKRRKPRSVVIGSISNVTGQVNISPGNITIISTTKKKPDFPTAILVEGGERVWLCPRCGKEFYTKTRKCICGYKLKKQNR